jgi:uncharacterized delta-60 repeat protein
MSGGTIDPTFGQGGHTKTGFFSNDVAVQADGKTITVGFLNADFAIKRLNVDGTPDATFGSDGLVTTDFGGKKGEMAMRVAIQSDGKIVVGGLKINSGFGSSTKANFAVARYNTNGSLDGTFGANGTSVIPASTRPIPWAAWAFSRAPAGSSSAPASSAAATTTSWSSACAATDPSTTRLATTPRASASTALAAKTTPPPQLSSRTARSSSAAHQYGGIDIGDDTQFCLARYTANENSNKSFRAMASSTRT